MRNLQIRHQAGLMARVPSQSTSHIDRGTFHDHHDHAYAIVGRTLDAVDTFSVELDRHILLGLADKLRDAFGKHAPDVLDVVTLVGCDKLYDVCRCDLQEGRLEHHHAAIGSLVDKLDFDLRCPGSAG